MLNFFYNWKGRIFQCNIFLRFVTFMKFLTLVLLNSNLTLADMTNKTKKIIFISLIIMSMISLGVIEFIDTYYVEEVTMGSQELSQINDNIHNKFEFCLTMWHCLTEIVSRSYQLSIILYPFSSSLVSIFFFPLTFNDFILMKPSLVPI